MIDRRALSLLALASATAIAPLGAQQASFVYRLGRDTVAVEQYTRTATKLTGEVASRSGAAVVRTWYDANLAADGRVNAVTYRIFGPDGKPIAGRPSEIRFTTVGDSMRRDVQWADSAQTRMFAAPNAIAFAPPSYGMLELAFAAMRRGNQASATFPVLNFGIGNALQNIAFTAAAGDTIRQANGLVYVVGRDGRLQAFDGSATTQKIVGTRGAGGLDIARIASGMRPMGVLSTRGTARAHFQTQAPGGVIMVDYGRPAVRDRTVWGGLLVPPDTIWRLGANEATHFATARELDFGGVIVPPGLYTLFLYNARSGPMLAINKQVGQWGTNYDQARDQARVPLTMAPTREHIEEFTISIRQSAPSRGALEFAWGSQMATANFVVR